MTQPLVDFLECAESPRVGLGFRGVAVRLVHTATAGQLRSLRLHGFYRVTIDDARDAAVIPLHKALVVTATWQLGCRTARLLGETIALRDDERQEGGLVSGYFNADAIGLFGYAFEGRGYVLVSLGPLVSNVATFRTG